eukprot:Nitzschia sp. Nitz4//scaffold8_size234185//2632//3715//NITZ4_001224-RA/size234185-augustus-gene-0.253-mRNA-1//-1//CDS//3329559707//6653//frame0
MTNFHGFCSYPHGGWVLTGLMTTCVAALAATIYGMGSCRFVYVDFQSDRGDFSEFYLDPTADGDVVQYRAGVGLFTWLSPFDDTDWSKGQCTGYTTLQQETFGDDIFETARIFGVLSVLTGIGATAWVLFLSCISLGRYQIWTMSLVLGLLMIFVGFAFLLFKSQLCTDLVSYQDASYTTECSMDQGGLVTIASSILWCVACLITVIYIKPPERDMMIGVNGEIKNAFVERQLERERQKREKARLRQKKEKVVDQEDGSSRMCGPSLSSSGPPHVALEILEEATEFPSNPPAREDEEIGNHRGGRRAFEGPSNIHIHGEI